MLIGVLKAYGLTLLCKTVIVYMCKSVLKPMQLLTLLCKYVYV